jgi:colanic acid biosynthesis glycosyl transferase WcaI
MRFLILTQYFPPETGAPQVRMAAMIRELLRLGHTVEVVTALPNYPRGKIFPEYKGHFYKTDVWEGVLVHRVWMYAATGAGIKRLLNYFSFMLSAFFGLRKAQKPDYLFVESPPLFLGITAYLAAKAWRVPFIFNVADLWPDSVRDLGLMREGFMLRQAYKLEAFLYRKASYITIVTEGLRKILIKEKQVAANKVLLLPNGIDILWFKPQAADAAFRTELGLEADKQLILYTGTHGYAHGMEVILHAAKLLEDTNVLFLCVGGGSEKSRLQEMSKQMQLTNVLFWESKTPEFIVRLYGLSFAGISTIIDSPLLKCARPAKALAIMACGKPVLYSGSGEGKDLVTKAEAGIVVSPGDHQALADAVRRLINNPDYAIELGKNGRTYIEKHLQWSNVVSCWLQQMELKGE